MSTVKPPKTPQIKTDDSNRFNLLRQKEALFMPCLILLLSALLTSVQSIVLSGKIR